MKANFNYSTEKKAIVTLVISNISFGLNNIVSWNMSQGDILLNPTMVHVVIRFDPSR